MDKRIEELLKYYNENDFPGSVGIEISELDKELPEAVRNGKVLADFMLSQPVHLHRSAELIGQICFDKSPVPADIFPRTEHEQFYKACALLYIKPQENLCTFDWQHSNPDLGKAVRLGLRGFIDEINESRVRFAGNNERLNFLAGLETFIWGMAARCEQYRDFCIKESLSASPERAQALRRIAANVERVPMYPAESFEEAVQCVYICWHCLCDSIGRPDQYLYPLYKKDIEKGVITRERAKALLQELFITINRTTRIGSFNDDKGGESHFAVGGYTVDHEDGFNELSELIIEAMMELPVYRPEVSLRWTAKTPFAVLKKMLDCERKDKYKRIAFANDEPRIRSIMEIMGLPWEIAYDYIMVGCNEPAFQGSISLSGIAVNIVRSLENVFKNRRIELLECADFDAFYELWRKSAYLDLETSVKYCNYFNALRSGDCNIMSSLFIKGCIERAESATKGGASIARCGFNLMGGTTLVDSLCIIKQFVYDEKRVSMAELADALDKNWQGYEKLHHEIFRDGKYFGNNDDFSNGMMHRFNHTLYDFIIGRREMLGNQIMFGNLTGYMPHFALFGEKTGATPDGRFSGEPLSFGSGQSSGRDRSGAASHLLAVAKMDPTGIMCANTVMNLTMDRETVENEESFDKFAHLVETYFKAGGLHLQLNYLSGEELVEAQKNPAGYENLRVRVSGYSGYFTRLEKNTQDNVIARTVNKA